MRRFLKKELLGIIKQLDKANEAMQKKVHLLSADQIINVLTECQQSAIAVGNRIDETEGEGTDTVTLLEEYCEELYSLSLEVGDAKQVVKITKRIRLLLNKISNSILYELPDSKKEVVFLPYKASMWDSLESVWKVASEDENVDTYVVPIPYFDKNPDGTVKEAYYEGNLYPDDVPITDFREYVIAERKPDIIFFHNPSDQYNHVTTVHPDYYAINLKKHTEQLIYIPYFVHQNDKVKDEYCILPGTVFADLVVLQSEAVKEQYIKYYREFMGPEKTDAKKFVALGSPKFEIKGNLLAGGGLPEEWQNLIYQDNAKKKVVFLNTHLMNLMQKFSDNFFLKIEAIFKTFKEKKDVVLLWRPHPLSMEAARSMNPEVAERYAELVERYKREGWGIYDETPDLHRAIAISDAYYGSYSSVAEMFKKAGKPVMIMNLQLK